MRLLLLAVALLSSTTIAAKPKVLVVDITVNDANLTRTGATLLEQVLTELSAGDRFEVIGSSDVALLLGIERQKQLAGCSEATTSCLAELGGALGTPWIISGALSQAGAVFRFDLKLTDTAKAKVVMRVGRTFDSGEALLRAVAPMLQELVQPIGVEPAGGGASPRVLPWVTLGVGAAAAGVGVALMVSAGGQGQALNSSKSSIYWSDLQTRGAALQTQHWVGVAMLGVGSALVVAGGLWLVLGREAPPVQVALGPGSLVIGGKW